MQTDGTAVCLRERDLAAKMEQLFRKNLYSAALSLTLSHAPDAGGGAEAAAAVRRKFGDHLYGKGDYDGAMAQCVGRASSPFPSLLLLHVVTPGFCLAREAVMGVCILHSTRRGVYHKHPVQPLAAWQRSPSLLWSAP